MNPDDIELYNFECIKCGKPNSKKLFDFTETETKNKRHRIITTKRNTKVPVCEDCKKDLEAWSKKHKTTKQSLCDEILCILIGFGLSIGGFIAALTYNILFIIAGIILLLITILYIWSSFSSRKSRNEINSPYQYIKFQNDKILVRPQGKGNWQPLNSWIQNTVGIDTEKVQEVQQTEIQKKVELEQDIDVIFCPNCGKKYNKGTEFCVKCGKDLRTLKENQ